jgi:hypothetical protein
MLISGDETRQLVRRGAPSASRRACPRRAKLNLSRVRLLRAERLLHDRDLDKGHGENPFQVFS